MNSSPIQLRKACLLSKLLSSKTQKMAQAAIEKHFASAAVAKYLPTDDLQLNQALEELVNDQILTRKTIKTGNTYQATAAATDYFKTLPEFPPAPPIDPNLKGFVLINMLAVGERRMLRKELKALITPAVANALGFSKEMMQPLMNALVKEQTVDEADPGRTGKDDKVSYGLTAQGTEEIARCPQHPAAVFKLTGEAINALLKFGDGQITHSAPKKTADHSQVPPGDDVLIDAAKKLLRERFGHTGLVPIFELRRDIREKFGEHAASHEVLDGQLKRLRREYRVRLVSISDRSRASQEELSQSIPGEEEMFFYLGDLR